ncbi:hypothetical protein C6W27_11315 [Bacillus paralicheniformis]|nr:hypothetical protein C6W27_11315 [Bacillus paralicheniformis]
MGGIEEWSDTWVKLPVDMSSEAYLSVLTKGSDQNEDMITLASRVVWMSPSQKWVIYGSRTSEICVIGFNDDVWRESLKSWQPLNDIVLGWVSVIFYTQTIPPDLQEIFQRHYGEKTWRTTDMFLKEVQMVDGYGEDLQGESTCITEMFLWELGKTFKTNDCQAIFFICGDFGEMKLVKTVEEEPDMLCPKHSYEAEIPFDLPAFQKLQSYEKKVMMAGVLEEAMLFVAEQRNWDKVAVAKAFAKMRQKDYKHQFKAWRPKMSPNFKLKAYPLVELDIYSFRLYLVIEDRKKNVIAKGVVAETETFVEDIAYYMDRLEWLSNDEVVIYTIAHKPSYFSLRVNGSSKFVKQQKENDTQ